MMICAEVVPWMYYLRQFKCAGLLSDDLLYFY